MWWACGPLTLCPNTSVPSSCSNWMPRCLGTPASASYIPGCIFPPPQWCLGASLKSNTLQQYRVNPGDHTPKAEQNTDPHTTRLCYCIPSDDSRQMEFFFQVFLIFHGGRGIYSSSRALSPGFSHPNPPAASLPSSNPSKSLLPRLSKAGWKKPRTAQCFLLTGVQVPPQIQDSGQAVLIKYKF